MTRVGALGWIGRGLALAGALLAVIGTFLHTNDFGGGSYFDEKSFGVFLLIVLLAAAAVTIVSAFVLESLLALVALALGALTLGLALVIPLYSIGDTWSYLGAGAQLPPIGAIAIIVGSLLALVDTGALRVIAASPARPFAPATAPTTAAAAHAPAPAAPPQASPPAGWYPDPAGAAPLRYWTGTTWSDSTRS